MDLPGDVGVTRCGSGKTEVAQIVTLSRESAKNLIDGAWWTGLDSVLRDLKDEPDRHWKWRVLISKYQNKPYFQAKCILTADGGIQAAILFRVDALSAQVPGERAIFIDRLATAPRNRDKLVQEPVFRGCGTGLLVYAIALSHFLGFEGRVNLFPIANEHFYARLGFIPTSVAQDGDTLFELPAEAAQTLLVERGMIDA